MEHFTQIFLSFIASWGYVAVAVLMAAENACIPIPSELILGFAGYLIFAGHMSFEGALLAGMVGGLLGSLFAYEVGARGGRPFVDKYGKYFLVKQSHVNVAQDWFDRYGLKAVFFSRMLPVVRTFISLPAGFARVTRSASSSIRLRAHSRGQRRSSTPEWCSVRAGPISWNTDTKRA